MSDHDPAAGAARADFCRYLAACYYEPGPEFVEEKVFESMREAALQLDPALAAGTHRLGEAFAASPMEDLLVDYTRLFLGPVAARARPYGSVWLGEEGSLMRDSTLAVDALYREGGFEIDEGFRELPDHVAAELEFLYVLLFREHEARRAGDAGALESANRLRGRLLESHLGRWIAPFAAAVRAGAETAYYREVAGLTERFIALEAARNLPTGGAGP